MEDVRLWQIDRPRCDLEATEVWIIMATTRRHAHDQGSRTLRDEPDKHPATSVISEPKHRKWLFWRHFLQMLAVMVLGMLAAAAILIAAEGVKSWDELTTQYPTQSL